MQKILILTDSACDLTKEAIEELGIRVIPFTITFGDKSFKETFDKSAFEVYEMMENFNDIPKTAQITAFEFEENYNEIYQQGYTDIIYVGINSKGSATYNNSIMAKESFFEAHPEAKDKFRIYNLDSTCYTGVYGYPITEAVKKIKKGASAEEIVAYFEEWFSSVVVFAVPMTLKYAKKSGRISAAAAFAGEMLGLKPLIQFLDGGTATLEKIRGEKNIIPKMMACLEKNMVPQTPYMMVCGKDDTLAKELEKEIIKKYGRKAESYFNIGAAVAANIGPDVMGIICRRKK
ncbi:MAG: DegV family protein [Ruminococcus sp.]|nr:DegV family protein [Ruminococcus sp.]